MLIRHMLILVKLSILENNIDDVTVLSTNPSYITFFITKYNRCSFNVMFIYFLFRRHWQPRAPSVSMFHKYLVPQRIIWRPLSVGFLECTKNSENWCNFKWLTDCCTNSTALDDVIPHMSDNEDLLY